MKKITLITVISLSILAFSIASCSKSSSPAPATPTLYDSLGGTAMVQDPTAAAGTKVESGYLLIRNIIDSTIFVIAADTQINKYFTVLLSEVGAGNLTGYENLSRNLTTFVAVGTGAKDYTYTGLSMPNAHNPSVNPRINGVVQNDDFTEFETDLVTGAGQAGVPSTTPALLSVARIVESLRSQVVGQ